MNSFEKHKIGLLVLLILLCFTNNNITAADSITLKDKTRLKGSIIDETDETVVILVKKERIEVLRKDISKMKRKKITYPKMPESEWACLGPGGGGAMYVPTLSPIDPNLGMIACDMGGTYLTRDRGINWTLLPTALIGNYAQGLCFSPHNPRLIFVGSSSRLFRSSDAGVTWTGVTENRQYPMNSVMDVIIDPDYPKLVWACFGKGGESGHAISSANRMLIERSTDGGKTFHHAGNGLPSGSGLVKQLAIDVNSPSKQRRLYAATSKGLYVSTDAGLNWRKKGKGFAKQDLRQVSVMCDRKSKKTIVLVSTEKTGVYRSEDGEHFSAVSGIPSSDTVEALAASINSADIAWACGSDIWKTIDGGKTWNPAFETATKKAGWISTTYPWTSRALRGIGCDPLNPQRVWVTGDMRFWSTNDGGKTFTELNSQPIKGKRQSFQSRSELGRHGLVGKGPMAFRGGGLEVTFVYQICSDPTIKKRVYSCCADIGGFRSDDNGESWSYNLGVWNKGIQSAWRNSCYDIVAHPKKRGLIYGAFSGLHNLPGTLSGSKYEIGGVAVSTDGGVSWKPFENAGLPNKPATSLCIDRRSKGKSLVIYATVYGTGVFISKDGGNSWQAMSSGLPKNVYAWRIRQDLDNTLYLICPLSQPGGLWRFDEQAQRWQRVDTQLKLHDVRDIVIAKDSSWEPGFIALAVSGSDNPGVYVSKDAGQNWQRRFDQAVTSVECTIDQKTWFCCGRGLWRGNNKGQWKKLDFPFHKLNDVSIFNSDESTLWIGSAGGGIFKGETGHK